MFLYNNCSVNEMKTDPKLNSTNTSEAVQLMAINSPPMNESLSNLRV